MDIGGLRSSPSMSMGGGNIRDRASSPETIHHAHNSNNNNTNRFFESSSTAADRYSPNMPATINAGSTRNVPQWPHGGMPRGNIGSSDHYDSGMRMSGRSNKMDPHRSQQQQHSLHHHRVSVGSSSEGIGGHFSPLKPISGNRQQPHSDVESLRGSRESFSPTFGAQKQQQPSHHQNYRTSTTGMDMRGSQENFSPSLRQQHSLGNNATDMMDMRRHSGEVNEEYMSRQYYDTAHSMTASHPVSTNSYFGSSRERHRTFERTPQPEYNSHPPASSSLPNENQFDMLRAESGDVSDLDAEYEHHRRLSGNGWDRSSVDDDAFFRSSNQVGGMVSSMSLSSPSMNGAPKTNSQGATFGDPGTSCAPQSSKKKRRTVSDTQKSYVCYFSGCDKAYRSQSSLNSHINSKHKGPAESGKTFNSNYELSTNKWENEFNVDVLKEAIYSLERELAVSKQKIAFYERRASMDSAIQNTPQITPDKLRTEIVEQIKSKMIYSDSVRNIPNPIRLEIANVPETVFRALFGEERVNCGKERFKKYKLNLSCAEAESIFMDKFSKPLCVGECLCLFYPIYVTFSPTINAVKITTKYGTH
eukprot:Nk52_evm1s704 gene=Nk52_evmTU1s704